MDKPGKFEAVSLFITALRELVFNRNERLGSLFIGCRQLPISFVGGPCQHN